MFPKKENNNLLPAHELEESKQQETFLDREKISFVTTTNKCLPVYDQQIISQTIKRI